MSNHISVTGNEAQFNENVDFLKNIKIQGTLEVPDIQTDGDLTVSANSISITGETTFLNRVNFSQDLSFTNLDLSRKLNVGIGGTILTAFVPGITTFRGIVGIGTTQPKEFFEVAGKGKIVDLDLENLNVTGLSTFTGITTQQSTFFGNQLSVSGLSTFNDTIRVSGTGNLILDGSGPQSLIMQDGETAGMQISYRTNSDDLVIERQADSSKFFLADRDSGRVELYHGDEKKLETVGTGITVFGDIVVPDVGIRTSRVGLGLTFDEIRPVTTTYFNDVGVGTLRLAVDGSISISKNIYDSAGSPGANGFYLQRDQIGIRWTAFEPTETEGIFIQDEGTFIPTVGTAKSYSIINFASVNSLGRGTDNIVATDGGFDDPGGGNVGLATIFTSDLWGFIGVGATASIYRLSNVGIGTALPDTSSQLDVLGDVEFRNQLQVAGLATFTSPITGTSNLRLTGLSTFLSDVDVNASLDVSGHAGVGSLTVTGVSTFNANASFMGADYNAVWNHLNNSLQFESDAKITLGDAGSGQIYATDDHTYIDNVGASRIFYIRLNSTEEAIKANPSGSVDLGYSGTKTFETSDRGVIITGSADVTAGLSVIGISTFAGNIDANANLDVDGVTDLDILNVSEVATFADNIIGNENLTITGTSILTNHVAAGSNLSVAGISTLTGDVRAGAALSVVGLSTFNDTVKVIGNVDISGVTTTNHLLVSGITTLGITSTTNLTATQLNVSGLSTFSDDLKLIGAGSTILFDKSTDDLIFGNDAKAIFGYTTGLEIYSTGDDSYVKNNTGDLFIQQADTSKDIKIQGTNGTDSIVVDGDADYNVKLFSSGVERLSTNDNGININGLTDTDSLYVSGVSTFVGISTFNNLTFTNQISNIGVVTSNMIHLTGGTYRADIDTKTDAAIVLDKDNAHIYTLDGSAQFLRNLISKDSNNIIIGQQNTSYIDAIDLKPGVTGSVKIHHGTTATDNIKLETTGVGVTILGNTESQTLKVTGISTFSGTVELDSRVKDQNDAVGTTVDPNLSNAITNATYNAATGIMVITIANHGFANGDSIKIPDGTITFSCNYNGSVSNQSYPRSKDPNSGKWLVISNVTTNTFQVDVSKGGVASGITHNFVSASGGVIHSSGQYVQDDYRLASVGTGVSWRPSGVQTKRTIWVSKSGSDTNSGLLEGDAKATIGAAASVAVETDTIKVRPGLYVEDNPIGLRTDVTITGEDLRLVTVQSKNPSKDVFHVRRGCLIENLNFGGTNVGISHLGGACVAFPPPSGPESAIAGYLEPGPATEGPSGRWRSPYVRNCTNFMTDSIGLKVDGNNATAASIGADLKSMVVDSFTQYNENGIGVSLTNNGYAQLVSIFTISCDIGIYADTGAQCDLTNSNSSFGNFGLVAVGLGSTQFTGIVSNTNPAGDVISSTNAEGQDTVVCADVFDLNNVARRPFDGQSLFFKINLNNYPDVNLNNLQPGGIDGSGRLVEPLEQIRSIDLIATGNDLAGFSAIDPPSVLIRDADGEVEPKGPQGVIAEATANIDARGFLTGINVIAQGRNYLPGQRIIVDIEGNTGLATAVMAPIFFTVESSTENPVGSVGVATITFNEFIPYELFPDDPFSLQRISRILTSSHSFEYVGAGTDINIATPLQGAIPIKENEIVARDGAQIPFTSTDQKGNFDIGEGLQINQTTSTISGRDFSRSLQAQVTPLILALR